MPTNSIATAKNNFRLGGTCGAESRLYTGQPQHTAFAVEAALLAPLPTATIPVRHLGPPDVPPGHCRKRLSAIRSSYNNSG